MKGIARLHPKYFIISSEFLADLGNQFVHLTLLDQLVFKGGQALWNLLTLSLITQAPSLFLGPVAGLWMDRLGVRRWLTMVAVGKGLLACLLALVLVPWIVFPAYLLFTVGSIFFHVGRLSVTPMLVAKEGIVPFNALNERVSLAGSIFGPWVIGLIILKTGQGPPLGLAGLLFVLSALFIRAIPRVNEIPQEPSRPGGRGGVFKHLLLRCKEPFKDDHELRSCFFILGTALLGGGILNIGLPMMFKTDLGSNIAYWGLVLSGFQVGSCLATFLLPRWSSRFSKEAIFSVTFLVLAGAMVMVGHLSTSVQIVLVMVVFGCGMTLTHVFVESLIQQKSPRAHLGKTMSFLTAYKGACYLGALLGSGLVLSLWDHQSLFLLGALFMVWASILTKMTASRRPARPPLVTD